jgi:deoxycytidine triphosphate deaminase
MPKKGKKKAGYRIVNISDQPYTFRQGERFLHLIVARCQGAIPYSGKYQH